MNRNAASVELREWLESDLPFLIQLRNNVPLQAMLLSTARGSDEAAVRNWLARRTEGADRIFRVISNAATNVPWGYLQAELADEPPDLWSFGICLDERFQGAGNGTEALMALEDELAVRFGARHLCLEVDKANERAIRCYRRMGYVEAGATEKQVIVCDEPRDVIVLAKSLTSIDDHP